MAATPSQNPLFSTPANKPGIGGAKKPGMLSGLSADFFKGMADVFINPAAGKEQPDHPGFQRNYTPVFVGLGVLALVVVMLMLLLKKK